jgi:tRNA1Val (adenine37-N6)-methyltransferase
MASEYFDFKQFRVYHQHCAMKVGTDSVVLGAIIPVESNERSALDIGTGSGLLALMLAQRCPNVHIDAVEIDAAAANQAKDNFINSPWSSRLSLHSQALQDFHPPKKYDIIVSNPPYFVSENSYQLEDATRKQARYTQTLTHQELLGKCASLLSLSGKLYVVIPAPIVLAFKNIALGFGLNQTFEAAICMKPNAKASRYVLGFALTQMDLRSTSLIVNDAQGKRSEDYALIASDFYL